MTNDELVKRLDRIEQAALALTDYVRRLTFERMPYVTWCEFHDHVERLRRLAIEAHASDCPSLTGDGSCWCPMGNL